MRHWSGCSANSRRPWASCAWVVSTPPTSTALTSITHSSSVSRSPSSSAAISSEIRSSRGSSWRARSSARVYSPNSSAARSSSGSIGGHLHRVELALDQVRPACRAASRPRAARPSPSAIIIAGIGLGERGDEVAPPSPRPRSQSVSRMLAASPAGGGRRPAGVNDGLHELAQPAVVVAVAGRAGCPCKRSYSGPEVTPCTSRILRPGERGARRAHEECAPPRGRARTSRPARRARPRSRSRSVSQLLVEARRRRSVGVQVVEGGQVELGDGGHGRIIPR